MSEKFNWQSYICKCGHLKTNHYKTNFLLLESCGNFYGNVDWTGCSGCDWWNTTCETFIAVKVPSDYWNFERGFGFAIKDETLLKLYGEEIKGKERGIAIMTAYEWLVRNEERYAEMLKEIGVEIKGYFSKIELMEKRINEV